MQRRSETMIARTSAETYENPKEKGHRNQSKESLSKKEHEELDTELDRELEDSFPASDPPSMTQPAPKPGGPERKRSKGK
jgi:hypothetical protein